MASISPLTKVNNIKLYYIEHIGKDNRPSYFPYPYFIEITEQIVVQEHVKPAVLRRVHHCQFGCIHTNPSKFFFGRPKDKLEGFV